MALPNYFLKYGKESQPINLEGKWSIVECKYVTPDGTKNIMEQEIKDGKAMTDFYFMADGKFKQTSNMAGSGTLDTYEGTWKTTEKNLIITLQINGQSMDIDYLCEQKNELLLLTRTSPDGKLSIVNSFVKK
jgi:hypothetical protein